MAANPDFQARFDPLWPTDWHDVTVLAAVSGGADSIALLRLLEAARDNRPGRLVVAHFNHALRHDADADEAFVEALAARLKLPCLVGRSGHAASGGGLEETARRARYEFLAASAARLGARYVVTAHTADDQVETVLHRILRGTGLAGLAGMRRARALSEAITLVRPLLSVRRTELRAFLESLGQTFREDPTNADLRFTRNRLRQALLPELAGQYNRNVAEALLRLSTQAAEARQVIDRQVAALVRDAVRFETGQIIFDLSRLAAEPRYLIREVCVAAWRRQGWPEQAMGWLEWDSLAERILASEAKNTAFPMLPGGIAVARGDERLVLVAR